MGGKAPQKKSFLRKNLDLILVLVIITPIYYAYSLTQPVSPFLPRENSYAPYERHYKLSLHFPFVVSYFMMTPANYQPDKYTYPLVVMLHGASAHMYGGKVLARPIMREYFPAFVVIPIAPFGFVWAMPEKRSLRPQALSLAMDVTKSVERQYSINQSQIYITGYSMGGVGTYAAISKYPGLFAAAAPTDAAWPPGLAGKLDNIPLRISHGTQDNVMPVQGARIIADVLKHSRRNVLYTEYPRYGHGAWVPTYEDPEFWLWLFSQKK